jgi:preprotein translocase subunit SecF
MKQQESFGRFDFVGPLNLFVGISIVLVIASLLYLTVRGLPYGIDFAGGTEVQVKFQEKVSIETLRKWVDSMQLSNVGVQEFGEGSEFIIRFQTASGKSEKETNELQNQSQKRLREALENEFSAQKPEIRRVDSVGPQVGSELRTNAYLAVFYCLLVILVYVGIRFDYKYAPGAVLCLFHDAIITLAIFVLVGKEINVPILAAILTLIGYSLNDTIVVFDRIRETAGLFKDRGIRFIINRAINDTLERTLITSGTTFVSSLALWIFADGTVSDIAFAICLGIFFGTYSSIYVAAPIVIWLDQFKTSKA